MIELGQWYKIVPEGIIVCFIYDHDDYYFGWIGAKGSRARFKKISLGEYVLSDSRGKMYKMNVPFKEHSMIKDIFEKEWIE